MLTKEWLDDNDLFTDNTIIVLDNNEAMKHNEDVNAMWINPFCKIVCCEYTTILHILTEANS